MINTLYLLFFDIFACWFNIPKTDIHFVFSQSYKDNLSYTSGLCIGVF